jgi:2,3-dihydroxybenzoate-AMP ligase
MGAPIQESELLPGCTAFPSQFSARYRAEGHWRGDTLWDLLCERATLQPDKLALVAGDRRLTYGQLLARAESIAAGLHAAGMRSSDRVIVQLPNSAELFELIFALFRLGAVPVMAHAAHRRLEIESFAEQSGAVAYVIADRHAGFDYRELARAVRAAQPSLRQVIVAGEAQEFAALSELSAGAHDPLTTAPPSSAQVALFQLSGGSTGTPKLIPRTHDDYMCSLRSALNVCRLDSQSVYLVALPALHNFPLSSPGSLGVWLAGGTVVLAKSATPDEAFPLIERERVTMTALVPALLSVWLDAVQNRRVDLRSLRVLQVGGAKLTPELARRVAPLLGCTLQQVFGMAEGLVCYTRLDDSEELIVGTQGAPSSIADEVRVLDDDDRPVATGAVGHLLTRGPYTVRGYYRADEHNARAFTPDGFYRTGDLVRQLPSGHLVVEGRAKDQINRGGEKIAAQEVEALLLQHPSVIDAAIVAMPDPLLGERACAFVSTREPRPNHAALTAFLRQRGIAAFKLPDRYEFVATLPATSVGKVDKKQLRRFLEERPSPRDARASR